MSLRVVKNFFAFLIILGICFARPSAAQLLPIVTTDSTVIRSLDSLLASMQRMHAEREELYGKVQQLDERLRTFERLLGRHVDNTLRYQRTLEQELDTLRSLIPSEEPIRAANLNIIYLNRRQDSMMAYIGRLENRILDLPKNQYWGVRNNFKDFDHLLLFTFLGAMMSLGVVLLVRTGKNRDDNPFHRSGNDEDPDSDADRMSIAITLLVGSVLVILFILFIL